MSKIRNEKVKREVRIRKNEVYVDLEATDVMPKEDFIELYDGRVKEKSELENRIHQYKEHMQKVKEFEKEESVKDIVKIMEKDESIAQKLYAILQKKAIVQQIQIWEKALEGMSKELSDLSETYKKLKDEMKK